MRHAARQPAPRSRFQRWTGVLLVLVLVLSLVAGVAHAFDCDHGVEFNASPCHACHFVMHGAAIVPPTAAPVVAPAMRVAFLCPPHEASAATRLPDRAVRPRAPPAPAVRG